MSQNPLYQSSIGKPLHTLNSMPASDISLVMRRQSRNPLTQSTGWQANSIAPCLRSALDRV